MDNQKQWDSMISFWFDRNKKDWFFPPSGLDDEIRTKYGDLISKARSGDFDHWANSPKGVLCLILLLDQFPRNVFRGSGESFSSDNKALQIVTQAIAQGYDKEIGETSRIQQTFYYLPFMHAEDLLAQIAGVALTENAIKYCEEETEDFEHTKTALSMAQRHMKCIAELARFPKRNEAIGRKTTEEEHRFLEENPQGF